VKIDGTARIARAGAGGVFRRVERNDGEGLVVAVHEQADFRALPFGRWRP